jgi:hypothetical protein
VFFSFGFAGHQQSGPNLEMYHTICCAICRRMSSADSTIRERGAALVEAFLKRLDDPTDL